ncbi:hypothetical protein ABI59_19910 [Acidobacteria bacterium Mor1]|nr:hypothetical protein ABI59_19910 [Acidobacteria bacterium Mor1]
MTPPAEPFNNQTPFKERTLCRGGAPCGETAGPEPAEACARRRTGPRTSCSRNWRPMRSRTPPNWPPSSWETCWAVPESRTATIAPA